MPTPSQQDSNPRQDRFVFKAKAGASAASVASAPVKTPSMIQLLPTLLRVAWRGPDHSDALLAADIAGAMHSGRLTLTLTAFTYKAVPFYSVELSGGLRDDMRATFTATPANLQTLLRAFAGRFPPATRVQLAQDITQALANGEPATLSITKADAPAPTPVPKAHGHSLL